MRLKMKIPPLHAVFLKGTRFWMLINRNATTTIGELIKADISRPERSIVYAVYYPQAGAYRRSVEKYCRRNHILREAKILKHSGASIIKHIEVF